jgi:filamentous hemagglutinin family protein
MAPLRGAVAALGLALAGWPVAAVGQTIIAPDVAAGRALGTNVDRVGTTFTVAGGTRAGGNLFHSFSRFDLAAGDTARWVRPDAGAINNVINRVTGGQVSTIAGTIDSTALPNATFYFINPAGIVFGPTAQVNVPAAAHFSTAAELRFANGDRFSIAAPNGSTLSVAAPEAWGFVGGQGSITIGGVDDNFSTDRQTLAFTAANLEVGDSTVFARGLDLIGVGEGAANVRIVDPLATTGGGSVQLFNSALNVIEATVGGRSLRVNGGVVDIETTGLTSNGNLFVHASERVEGVFSGFDVFSVTRESAGAIVIRAPEVFLTNTTINADAIEDGAPGRVLIETGDLFFFGVELQANAKDGVGAEPGLIMLKSRGDLQILNSSVLSNANGAADGGQISIEGRDVEITQTEVQSNTVFLATGAAGGVTVKADTLLLGVKGLITSTTDTVGEGGNVFVDAGQLRMETKAAIRADALDAGNAGSVTVIARTIDMSDQASITSRAQAGTGDAGEVLIQVGRLTMVDAIISSGTNTRGAAGTVAIEADDIVLDGDRRKFTTGISSDTFGNGNAGDVLIQAKTMVVRNGAFVSSDTVNNAGAAGNVIVVADDLTVENGGAISSDSLGEGDAGNVAISAGKLAVLGGDFDITFISSDSLQGGNAGTVSIAADSILVDGQAFISSDTYSSGDAGEIVIAAGTIDLRNFGNIRSQTQSVGNAGSVEIEATTVTLQSGGAISSAATNTSKGGNAGGVIVTADTIIVGRRSEITTSTGGEGNAGIVSITAKDLTVDGGTISSSADIGATGSALALFLEAETFRVINGGAISTLSTNPNGAGVITIAAGTLTVDGQGSIIGSENQAGNPNFGGLGPGPGGDAGGVLIGADNLTISNGGRISTNSFKGAAGAIEIRIDRPGLFILEGADAPGVIQTSSGPGTGGMITIIDPLAIISNGGAILALGQQAGANVQIQSRYFINSTDRLNVVSVDGEFNLDTGLYDVSSGTVSRDLSVLDASKVLRGQCPAARSTGAVSQLITRPVGPYAREPAIDVLRAPPPGGCP